MNNQELTDRLTKIIEDSDDRMRLTNAMINRLVETIDKLTAEYSKHLDSLRVCRDNQAKIIEEQQHQIHELQNDLRQAVKRNDDLVDKVLLRNNIQVTQS